MALVSLEDLLAPAPSSPTRAVHELMLERVHSEAAPMPPAGNRRLTPEELHVIDTLSAAGLSGTSTSECAPDQALIAQDALAPSDDTGECHSLQAHELEVSGDLTPHVVERGEHYSCFYFEVPWASGAQAVSLNTHAGPTAHHIELFHFEDAQAPGRVLRQQPHCGFTPRVPLAIWGLGQRGDQPLPAGVGLELPAPSATRRLYLEVHYSNPGEVTEDTSRVDVCLATQPRPQAAGIADLSSPAFALPPGAASTISATCTPTYQGEIHLFRVFPHMHALGRSFQSVLERAGGPLETILDVGYDVGNQRTHDVDAVMRPGDRLLSHCNYVNDTNRVISAGFTAEEEMCVPFVYAWPSGALSNGELGFPATCWF